MTDTNASLKACPTWITDELLDQLIQAVLAHTEVGLRNADDEPALRMHKVAVKADLVEALSRTPPESSEPTDEGLGALSGSKATPEARSGLRPSGYDPARCRNCGGEQWVCENHQDTPWEANGHAEACGGAGAPCPVCNRDMACAPYLPMWNRDLFAAPKDGTEILICGGTVSDDTDWTDTQYPFVGYAVVRFQDGGWNGGPAHAHDAYRWHTPAAWMRLPAIATEAGTATTVEQGVVHEGAGPKGITQEVSHDLRK